MDVQSVSSPPTPQGISHKYVSLLGLHSLRAAYRQEALHAMASMYVAGRLLQFLGADDVR